jgi:hypothetical protein
VPATAARELSENSSWTEPAARRPLKGWCCGYPFRLARPARSHRELARLRRDRGCRTTATPGRRYPPKPAALSDPFDARLWRTGTELAPVVAGQENGTATRTCHAEPP